jgi:beta-lactamase regulating signal transducer with metallopeptidase domain
VGTFCLAGSILCLLVFAIAVGRTTRAVLMTARYAEHSAGVALLGIFRPRFFISADLARTLPADELAAALRHEQAHWSSRDNVKRLLFLLSPDLLPGWSGFERLERNWGRLAEWAADDQAVNGEPQWSLSLAAALVRVARAKIAGRAPTLASTLIGERCDLGERVNRILNPQPNLVSISLRWTLTSIAALVLAAGAMLSAILPNSLYRVLEMFLH